MSDRPRTASSGHSGYASVRTPSRAGTASSAGRSYTGSELAALVQQRNAIKAQLHRVDVALAREQTSAVRTELGTLLEDVSALEARSEASVGGLRAAVEARDRFADAKQSLQQAERVRELMRAAESALARGDASRSS